MKLTTQKPTTSLKDKETLAILLTKEAKKNIKKSLPDTYTGVVKGIDTSFFKGNASEILFVPLSTGPNLILCGLGEEKDVNAEALRNSASALISLCREKAIAEISILPPALTAFDDTECILSISEGLTLANYSFDTYRKIPKDEAMPLLKNARFLTDAAVSAQKLKEITIISENTLLCRDLINETSDKCTPELVASLARKIGKRSGVTCKIYTEKEMKKLGMGLILAVNRGSVHPPRLVVLKYTGNPKSKKYCALVGKGITFDSGGINLKPTGHIEDMRSDMSGAAATLYALKAASELKLKKNIYAVMPMTENMIAGNAFRPGDIYRAMNGKSVEIGNTDAEGRLVLADALAFTEKKLKPSCIIDMATLTGACLVALGETVAAYITTDTELGKAVSAAGEKTGDRVWELPLYKEYEDGMKSDIADINNISSDRNAGTIMGAVFLKNFIEKTPWLHIDIAGTSWYSKKRGYRPKYATGFGVRLFVEMITEIKD